MKRRPKSRELRLGRFFYFHIYPVPAKAFGEWKLGMTLTTWKLHLLVRWG
jgi:hypothetical protein